MMEFYKKQADQFFLSSEAEIDPDSAIFIVHQDDPAFWITWSSDIEFYSEIETDCSLDLDHREKSSAIINQYLHGLIEADIQSGSNGNIAKKLIAVLDGTGSPLVGIFSELHESIAFNMSNLGPYSQLTKIRFVQYFRRVLDADTFDRMSEITGLYSEENSSLRLLSAINHMGISDSETNSLAIATKRLCVYFQILSTWNKNIIVSERGSNASDSFSPDWLKKHFDGYEKWPEWQLLCLLKDGLSHANEIGIDLDKACFDDELPFDRVFWTVAFDGSRTIGDFTRSYIFEKTIPSLDPKVILEAILPRIPWRIAPAQKKWVLGYIDEHQNEFVDVSLNRTKEYFFSLMEYGVKKDLIIRHPDSFVVRGHILEQDLGL